MTKVEVWKYDAKNKKANYAKDKYNESERKEETRAIMNMVVHQNEIKNNIRRLRSEKNRLITDEKLVSFVGEVPTPTQENKKINKNGSEKNE